MWLQEFVTDLHVKAVVCCVQNVDLNNVQHSLSQNNSEFRGCRHRTLCAIRPNRDEYKIESNDCCHILFTCVQENEIWPELLYFINKTSEIEYMCPIPAQYYITIQEAVENK